MLRPRSKERPHPKDFIGYATDESLKLKLMSLLDSYRINRSEDYRWVDEAVEQGKFKSRIAGREWKDVRKELTKMATIPKSMPHLVRISRIRQIVLTTGQAFTVIFLVLMIMSVQKTYFGFLSGALPYFTFLTIASMAVSMLIKPLSDRKISLDLDEFNRTHPDRFTETKKELKAIVQDLIHEFKQHTRKNLDKVTFTLYNLDYEDIEVVKTPRMWRKYYSVRFR